MELFKKNANETTYVGGKKHWADVIKNSATGELLIWRQPEEDFNTKSTLIVMPGEQAIFVKGGSVEQVFESGTYKLTTQNYPFISRLRNATTGGISTFNCVVYFVRTAHTKELYWGTDSPIQARDKIWGVRTDLRARGAYKVHIDNPVMFLEKLLGNNIRFECQEELDDYFFNEFQSKIRSVISRGVNELQTELIGLDAMLDEFSAQLAPSIDEVVSQYGLKCDSFSIAALDVDKSKYDAIDEAQVEAARRAKFAQGEAAEINILGDKWEKQQAVNIMQNLSTNPNSAGMGTLGAGLGMGFMAGGAFGSLAGQVLNPAANTEQNQNTNPKGEDPVEVLAKLKKLLDAGLIEQSEYDAKKAEILSRM
jgi:membrane protease subunit (stomatin/prohibitin family)